MTACGSPSQPLCSGQSWHLEAEAVFSASPSSGPEHMTTPSSSTSASGFSALRPMLSSPSGGLRRWGACCVCGLRMKPGGSHRAPCSRRRRLMSGPCLRVSSQQGSRQQGLQSSHCGHCCKETQQEPRVPGTAGRRMLWTTAGQIHSHHYHKPCTKGLRLFARGLSVRGLSFPRRGISSSTQLLFGPGPRIGEHHVPAFTVLPHPETDPQSQGQYSSQGKQLLIQGWGTQHHQQGQGGAPL